MKVLLFCLLLSGPADVCFGQRQIKDSVYTSVDQMPEFPGGMSVLMKYISQHLKASKEDIENNGYSVKIIATFVVGVDGKATNIKLVRSIGPETDKSIIELLEKMPVWKPGVMNGKKVSVLYKLPVHIHFRE